MSATCCYCGKTFEPPRPDTAFCRECYYSGRHHEDTHKDLLYRVRSIDTVDHAVVWHTGGGCWGLGVTMKDGRFLFATVAIQQEGRWYAEADLPDAGEPWGVSVNPSADAFWNGESNDAPTLAPLTDDEFVEAVRTLKA